MVVELRSISPGGSSQIVSRAITTINLGFRKFLLVVFCRICDVIRGKAVSGAHENILTVWGFACSVSQFVCDPCVLVCYVCAIWQCVVLLQFSSEHFYLFCFASASVNSPNLKAPDRPFYNDAMWLKRQAWCFRFDSVKQRGLTSNLCLFNWFVLVRHCMHATNILLNHRTAVTVIVRQVLSWVYLYKLSEAEIYSGWSSNLLFVILPLGPLTEETGWVSDPTAMTTQLTDRCLVNVDLW